MIRKKIVRLIFIYFGKKVIKTDRQLTGASDTLCLCKDMMTKEIRVCRETAEMPDIPVDRKNEPGHRHTPI